MQPGRRPALLAALPAAALARLRPHLRRVQLLLARDRSGADDLPQTHEFLAQMLAVRRASVTEALAPLQAAGLLRQDRGRVVLCDRAGLEAVACSCYPLIRAEFAAFAAYSPGAGGAPAP